MKPALQSAADKPASPKIQIMELRVCIDWVTDEPGRHYACGVVIVDTRTMRPIHESGHWLGAVPSDLEAAYRALLIGTEIAAAHHPENTQLRTPGGDTLANTVTGAAPVEPTLAPWHERIVSALLQLDGWYLDRLDRAEEPRAASLAQRALRDTQDLPNTPAPDSTPAEPRWVVEFSTDTAPPCPKPTRMQNRYGFGPDTPAGLCVHAASAALSDGPLTWTDPAQRSMTTSCPKCGVPLSMRRVD